MEHLPNGYTLSLCDGAFPLSTDSMVLSHFVKLPKHARILDLGSGCGTLGLLLCSKDPSCHVTGVELEEPVHQAALENICRNALPSRMESICADLRSVSERFSPGSFSCCVSNPPYFPGGPASKTTPLARREDTCTPEDLFRAASWALKFGGDFFLVHKPERLAELIAKASAYRLEAKRLCLVRHRADAPVSLVLLQLRKGAKPGLLWEELTLHNADGSPTPIYREIYHMP
ncbi:MAG: methyltransferase [Oscillospiraceae bacterium]|nr:methyltransferase [Oscillospiraceae bacterium]